MKRDNHEEHEERNQLRQEREDDPMSPRAMRVASPLSPEEERVMHRVIGSAIAVHRVLGPGFLESIYRKALCVEFEKREIHEVAKEGEHKKKQTCLRDLVVIVSVLRVLRG